MNLKITFLLFILISPAWATKDDIFYDALDTPYEDMNNSQKLILKRQWVVEEKLFAITHGSDKTLADLREKRKLTKLVAENFLKKVSDKLKKLLKKIPKSLLKKIAESGGDTATTYALTQITEKVLSGELLASLKSQNPPNPPGVLDEVASSFKEGCRTAAEAYWKDLPNTIDEMAQSKKISNQVQQSSKKVISAVNGFMESLAPANEYYESVVLIKDEKGVVKDKLVVYSEAVDSFVLGHLHRYANIARSFGNVCYRSYQAYKDIDKQTPPI